MPRHIVKRANPRTSEMQRKLQRQRGAPGRVKVHHVEALCGDTTPGHRGGPRHIEMRTAKVYRARAAAAKHRQCPKRAVVSGRDDSNDVTARLQCLTQPEDVTAHSAIAVETVGAYLRNAQRVDHAAV